jgi:adenylate kinase
VPDDVLTERLLTRGRDDDSASVIAHRLAVYRSQTLPMLHWYTTRQQLVLVDGHASVADVTARMVRGMQEWLLRRRLAS